MDLRCASRCFGLALAAWLLLAFILPTAARAQTVQTVAGYSFSGVTGAPTSTAPGVSGSSFIRDPSDNTFYDNTAGNPAPDTNSSGWTTAATLDLTRYYTFTVTPASGGSRWNGLTLDAANFDAAGINDGPTLFAVRSSLDGFTSNLLTGTVGAAFATTTTALNVMATSPVEYRIYGFGAGTTQGLLQLDNVALTFAAAVPEPSTWAALGCGLFATAVALARRRA